MCVCVIRCLNRNEKEMDETEEDVEEKGGYKLNKKGFRLEKEKKKNT